MVVLAYLVLAASWIFLSDQLLLLLINQEQLVNFSMLKGMFFVLVSAVGLALALKNVPMPAGAEQRVLPLKLRHIQVRDYMLAVVLVGMMLWFRLLLPEDIATKPMMILQLFPVILAAVFGSFRRCWPRYFCHAAVNAGGWLDCQARAE